MAKKEKNTKQEKDKKEEIVAKEEAAEKTEKPVAETKEKVESKTTPAKEKTIKIKVRSPRYRRAHGLVDRHKFYPLAEAVSLAQKTSVSRFIGNLDAHLVVDKIGDVAEVEMPFFKGKEKKVAIVTDEVVEQIKNGKIDFDVLLASPKTMSKVVPLARTLGPKGLMPNPKNGTLVDDPEKAAKKFGGSSLKVRTEKKAALAHLTVGKINQPAEELIANLEALLKAAGRDKVKKLSICTTMGPGIKVALE